MDWEDVSKWAIAAVTVVAVAWAPVACVRGTDAKIEEAIKSGVDPIKARCAYRSSAGGNSSSDVICAMAANNGGGQK